MVEHRVDITVGASTEGFEDVQRDAERLTQAAARAAAEQAKGYQKAQEDAANVSAAVNQAIDEQKTGMASVQQSTEAYQTEIAKLESRLGDLKTQQQATVRAMLDVEKATPAWEELKKRLAGTNEDIRLADTALNMLKKSAAGDGSAADAVNELVEGFTKAKHSQRDYRNEVRVLKRELQDLAKEQLAVSQALGKTEKGSQAYKLLRDRMRDVGERSRETEGRLKAVERATGRGMPLTERDMARGAFVQGLVQGALPGIGPIQRGPGMRAQLAGTAIGRGGRGVVQGLFGGVQGMQQMLAAAPVPGAGVLAAQFGQGMGFAGGGLQQMAARFRGAPMLGGIREVTGRVERARMGARRRALARAPELTPAQIEQEAARAREREVARLQAARPGLPAAEMEQRRERAQEYAQEMMAARDQRLAQERETAARRMMARTMAPELTEVEAAELPPERLAEVEAEAPEALRRVTRYRAEGVQRFQEREDRPVAEARITALAEEEMGLGVDREVEARIQAAGEEAAQRERETLEAPRRQRLAAERRAARRARREMFRPIRRAGAELGAMTEQQAIQFTQQVAQRGGGGVQDLQQQGMLQAAMAAQTAYGVGPEVAGAFQMGGRRAAMVGAPGRAGAAMAETIGDALALGLEGSELTDYMQQMASGIETWKQTGMPINPRSIGQMASEFAQTGIGGLRGGIMGRGLMEGLQRISQQGITSGVELMAAQTFGGFQGGGLGGFWESQRQLEAGGGEEGFSAEQMRDFIQQAMEAGGGGTGGMFTLREVMRQMGVQMGVAETEQLAQAAMAPGEMTEEQVARMATVREQMAEGARGAPQGVEDITADARAMVGAFGKEIKRAADLQNEQNDLGERLVPTFQNLQKSSLAVHDMFGDLVKGPLQQFSEISLELTTNLNKLNTQLMKAGKMGAWDVWSKIATSMF